MTRKPPNSRRNLDLAISQLAKGKSDPQRIKLLLANAIVGQMLPSVEQRPEDALRRCFDEIHTRS